MSVKKLCFVSPRYGEEIIGGAEFAIRRLAENCVLYGGIEAEVLTTIAGDERTWSPQYEVGETHLNGVTVKRFSNEPINRQEFDQWAQPLLENPRHVTEQLFDEWLIRQGPYSPHLLNAIENTDADAVVFHPMLSSPTSHGVFKSKKPVILHPALHNEPLSYMPGYAQVMKRADLLALSTRYEQNLVQDICGAMSNAQSVIGFGIEEPPEANKAEQEITIKKYGLEPRKYFVVIGRVDQGKGSDVVAEMFCAARKLSGRDDKLVFIGPISPTSAVASMDDENIICVGAVSDEEKYALLSEATSLINPSVAESFSLVVLEAMQVGVPVIVNGSCGPTIEHAQASGAGVSFSSAGDFAAALDLYADNKIRKMASLNGQGYISKKYIWSDVVSTYMHSIDKVLS